MDRLTTAPSCYLEADVNYINPATSPDGSRTRISRRATVRRARPAPGLAEVSSSPAPFKGFEFDNGPHSITRVQFRMRLLNDAKSSDPREREEEAVAILKF
jgi:hypothetical protein